MNYSSLRQRVAEFCEDPNQTKFSTTQYLNACNEAQQQFALDSKALFKDTTLTVVDGTATCALPTDFMWEKKVTHKGLQLKPITRGDLDNISDDWTDEEGTPTYFIIDPEEAVKKITLYPIPQADDAGANLVLTYYPFPANLVDETDTPLNASLLMVQFHIGIAAYAAWLLWLATPMTVESQTKMGVLLTTYNKSVSKAIQTFGNTKSAPLRMKGGRYW